MSCIRSPWCVITVLAEYRRCRADFKIKSTSCGLKPRNSSMFWASAERNRKRAEENLVLKYLDSSQHYLDSPEPRNTVRFNRLMLQGPDERAYREIGARPVTRLYGRGV